MLSRRFWRTGVIIKLTAIDFQFLTCPNFVLSRHDFFEFLITQLEAIKFACDWDHRQTTQGARKYKSGFVLKAFEKHTAHNSLRVDGTEEERLAYKTSLKVFKTTHAKTITARNRLLLMYQKVIRPKKIHVLLETLILWNSVRLRCFIGSSVGCQQIGGLLKNFQTPAQSSDFR
jgi:hypothetical protein